MLFPIVVQIDADGQFRGTVPDLDGCDATGGELGQTLTRVHLKIEGRISELLIAGEELPEPNTLDAIQQRPENRDLPCYEIHINLVHLRAVAKHQAGR
jgi:predicted RNase H-like HicB family nuclease